MTEVHLSNMAANMLLGTIEIGRSYGDNNLESIEYAERLYDFLQAGAFDAFTLITTGDIIIPRCCIEDHPEFGSPTKNFRSKWVPRGAHDCETDDANYRYLLIPTEEWERQKKPVLKADRDWRIERSYCFDILPEIDYWWWCDTETTQETLK